MTNRQRPNSQGDEQADEEVVHLYDLTGINLLVLPPIMSPTELAPAIGTTTGALAQDRFQKRGIPYIRLGTRNIRYTRANVARYLISRYQRPEEYT